MTSHKEIETQISYRGRLLLKPILVGQIERQKIYYKCHGITPKLDIPAKTNVIAMFRLDRK